MGLGIGALQRAVFLDRDGTLAEDVGYCRRPEDFWLFPYAAKAVAQLNRLGHKVIVVTNQSGIARGFLSEDDLAAIHDKMYRALAAGGATVDALYYCPHHPDNGCQCRKPAPGLLLRAAEVMGLDLAKSYVVGDREADVLLGRAVGCRTILVETGPTPFPENGAPPNYRAPTLLEAVNWIAAQAQ